ncbi:MAG: DUF1559 domain-containing protein [Acidobacteria bacterium]|nr:DUF1559 domain-containing protein [Acidobacteriota bacterium]
MQLSSISHSQQALTMTEALILLVVIILLAGLVDWGAPLGARERARKIQCLNNLRQIGLGLEAYAADHDGRYPAVPSDLVQNYLFVSNYVGNAGSIFKCPSDFEKVSSNSASSVTLANISYSYVPGLNTHKVMRGGVLVRDTTPIAFDRGLRGLSNEVSLASLSGRLWQHESPHKEDGGNILFTDCHVWFQDKFPPNAFPNQVLTP